MSARARSWYRSNTFSHADFPVRRLAAERGPTVSVCLPAKDEASTIGATLEQLLPLRDEGLVDQVVDQSACLVRLAASERANSVAPVRS